MRNLLLTLLIWIIAFASITAGAAMTYSWYRERGPQIKIVFQNASGLVPNKSKIIYRGVQVGNITAISLDQKYEGVTVVARMTRQAGELLGHESKFWIVQPEFGLDKISNLSAIATGDYIEMEPVKGKFSTEFVGLKQPPSDHPRLASGLRLIVRASNLGGINDDSPILYRGFQIGNVWDIELSKDKKNLDIIIYIYEEYGDLVRKSSYFTNVSGFHADIHIFGTSRIGMDSLSTLIRGGINLTTPSLNGPLAKEDDVYRLISAEQALGDD